LYWKWLHRLAIYYPRAPALADANQAFSRMWTFFTRLPCPKCRAHVAEYLERSPIDLANSRGLQVWCWKFHNAVNVRLKKPLFSFEAYLALYAEDIRLAAEV
jgi:FAD-linked sulfhydryl oxidase